MRNSRQNLFKGFWAQATVRLLAIAMIIVLGASPLVMQRLMVRTHTTQVVTSFDMPTLADAAPQAMNGGCVHMAPCTAILSQAPVMRGVGLLSTRLVSPSLPLAVGRALAPPFQPPIV